MNTELATRPQAEPATYSQDQLNLLKDTIAKGATDQEFALFVEVCKRKNLDPFAKQIHMVKRWDAQLKRQVATYQTGIDGFRLIAERTGQYEGQEGPWWCGDDGKWSDVWTGAEPPVAAKVGVYRRNFRQALYAVALYREFVQTNNEGQPNSMWRKMPANQLSKCAEAAALRKAFPEELGGLYANEEMGQADNSQQAPQHHVATPLIVEPAGTPQPLRDPTLDGVPEEVAGLWSYMGKDGAKIENVLYGLKQQIESLSGTDKVYREMLNMSGMTATEDCRKAKIGVSRKLVLDLWLTVDRWQKANTPPPNAPPPAEEITADEFDRHMQETSR